jgi:hypothetical protein
LIVGGVPRLKKRARLLKFSRLYTAAGYDLDFAGWERRDEEAHLPADELLGTSTILHHGGGWGSKELAFHYPLWSAKVLSFVWQSKPTVVHALGLETALPVMICNLFVKNKMCVIFDNADRFSYSHPIPTFVKRPLEAVERWVAKRSAVHIIPGTTRYPDGTPAPKTILLKNSPGRAEIAAAKAAEVPPRDESHVVLYVNGWVGASRGTALALRLSREFADNSSFRILVAGRLTGEDAEDLVRQPSVDFRGEVSNVDALALYRQASLCLTMYDPVVEINKHAASNK